MKLLSSDSDPYPPCIKPHLFSKITKTAGICTSGSCLSPRFHILDTQKQVGVNGIKRHKKDGIVYDDPIRKAILSKTRFRPIFLPYPE